MLAEMLPESRRPDPRPVLNDDPENPPVPPVEMVDPPKPVEMVVPPVLIRLPEGPVEMYVPPIPLSLSLSKPLDPLVVKDDDGPLLLT